MSSPARRDVIDALSTVARSAYRSKLGGKRIVSPTERRLRPTTASAHQSYRLRRFVLIGVTNRRNAQDKYRSDDPSAGLKAQTATSKMYTFEHVHI